MRGGLLGKERWWARREERAFAPPTIALLRQQRKRAVPVFRRRVVTVVADSCLIEIVEQLEHMGVVGAAAALDRLHRAVPVATAIARQHLDGEVAQALKAAGLRGVL